MSNPEEVITILVAGLTPEQRRHVICRSLLAIAMEESIPDKEAVLRSDSHEATITRVDVDRAKLFLKEIAEKLGYAAEVVKRCAETGAPATDEELSALRSTIGDGTFVKT